MHKRTTVKKAVVAATCALAVALSTIGMGVASAWADLDHPVVLQQYAQTACSTPKYTPISFGRLFPPEPSAGHNGLRVVQGTITSCDAYRRVAGNAWTEYVRCAAANGVDVNAVPLSNSSNCSTVHALTAIPVETCRRVADCYTTYNTAIVRLQQQYAPCR
jgi:hypothetical protein